MRRVVVAPDKFKGSATAHQVARAIAQGIRRVAPHAEIVSIPMADGGDGTVDVFVDAGWQQQTVGVHDALGRSVEARFALDGGRAVVELASASGLALLAPGERDPWRADTRGTGELIRAALDAGAREIVVGIGGSATNDAGIGMLRALGARTEPPDALHGVRRIDLSTMDARLKETRLTVASDVDNPLCGPAGASRVFGPQKGATPDDVARLDAALAQTADAMAAAIGRDLRDERGAGAAGGAGFALMAIGGKIRPGVDIVAELRGLPKALKGSGLCVTGEGAIDAQTLHGKTISGVGRYASQTGVPVIAFAGAIDAGAETELWKHGIACVSITAGPMRLEDAMRDAETLLTAAAARAVRLLLLEEERL
ncbi:MAG: glycerate kinase [Vulcanimicrobiaceae bacterium]